VSESGRKIWDDGIPVEDQALRHSVEFTSPRWLYNDPLADTAIDL
jgi:hypothetical protein